MKPLSKKIRKTSLVISLLAFVIIGPIVLAYSLGYRFNELEEKFGLVRTGGIYINSDVGDTRIYIDTEFYKNSGSYLRNIFVQNLKVGEEHLVEVHKDGYYSWAKKLPVFEGYVTEVRTLLIPQEIGQDAVYPFVDISGVGTTTDNAETIYNPEYKKLEALFNLASTTKNSQNGLVDPISGQLNVNKKDTGLTSIESEKLATSTKEIPEYFVKLGIDNPDELDNLIINNDELTWIQNGDVLIHWIGSIDKIPYYFCNFKECKEKITLDWETDILKFDFMPNRKDVLLVLNNEGLWVVEVDDRSSSNIFPIYLGEGIDFIVNEQNKILVLDSNIFYELDF